MAHKEHDISAAPLPKCSQTLKSFLGSINQLQRFFLNMAPICDPLRALLRKNQNLSWSDVYTAAYRKLMQAVQSITELRHFSTHQKVRIVCDASHKGFVTNELEMLTLVWACERFRNYLFGHFHMYTDHQALLSALKKPGKQNLLQPSDTPGGQTPAFRSQNYPPSWIENGTGGLFNQATFLQGERISKYDKDFLVHKINALNQMLNPMYRTRKCRIAELNQPITAQHVLSIT